MTRNIRKVVSIICVVAILMSLCVVSMLNQGSAFSANSVPTGGTLKLDFENKTGISAAYTDDADALYVTDPADPGNTVVKVDVANATRVIEIGKAGATLGGGEAFSMQPNTTYKFAFDFKAAAGSHGYLTGNGGANRLVFQFQRGTSLTGGMANIKTQFYGIDPRVNTKTTTVTVGSSNETVNVLAEDTAWQKFTALYTTGATVDTDNLYVKMIYTASLVNNAIFYIDNVTIDVVDSVTNDDGEDLNNTYVFNFKEDATNDYWNPVDWKYLSNSDKDLSYAAADGLHFTVNYANATASTNAQTRQKAYLYDKDYGGYFQLKKGALYSVKVKYKLVELGSSEATIGLVHSKAGQADPKMSPDFLTDNNIHLLGGISETAFAKHTATTSDWQYLDVSFTADDVTADTFLAIAAHGSDNNDNKFLIESVEVKEMRIKAGVAIISYETNGGNAIEFDTLPAGTPSSELPIPTHSSSYKGFAGWYLDAELTQPVGETIEAGNYSVYAKWTQDISAVTFNNSGEITTVNLAKGTALSRPERPNSKLFFEGWYSDLAFTNKVTVVPDYDVTLYAKYNYTYIGFNNGGVSDNASYSDAAVVTDPDDANNKVLQFSMSGEQNNRNFEIGVYDAVETPAYEMPYTNTTYYISFKVKIPAGSKGGTLALHTGTQSEWHEDLSKTGTGIGYSWNNIVGAEGTDWVTVTKYFSVGDNFYRDRVNFNIENRFYLLFMSSATGEPSSIYIDDIIVGAYSEEVPEGAVGVYFKTNSEDIAPLFGYTGEALSLPEDPVLAGHKFIGWYSDMNFINKFNSSTFGDKTVTLYAKWESVPQKIDFENFYLQGTTSDRFNYVVGENNSYLRYNYEQGSSGSVPGAIARAYLNSNGSTFQIVNGAGYKVTFKYKIEETTGTKTSIGIVTHGSSSTWVDSKEQIGRVTFDKATDGWVEGELTFTADCLTDTATYVSLGVAGDATILIDDIVIDCTTASSNVYGSVVISFETNGGSELDPYAGDPGLEVSLPTPKRSGYTFGGWYKDSTLITKFTDKVFGEEDLVLYAKWVLGKMTESYEDFPSTAYMGLSSAYVLYDKTNSDVTNFDAANVQSGSASIFRDGTATGAKGFTVCRDSGLTLGVGEQYTLTFYVKPTNVTNNSGVINLMQMSSNTSVSAPDAVETITDVGSLKVGEWQKVTYTFTTTEQYIGIQTTEGNDIYFDNFTVNLKKYTGTTTGDTSVNPIIVMLMVVLAAGTVLFTGKKVFSK